jgi:hypothetical protein
MKKCVEGEEREQINKQTIKDGGERKKERREKIEKEDERRKREKMINNRNIEMKMRNN